METTGSGPAANKGGRLSEGAATAKAPSGSSRAVMLMLGAGLALASMAATVKLLAGDIPVPQILFFRNISGGVIILAILRKQGVSPLGVNRKVLLMRGSFGTLGLFFYFTAIAQLELADAVILNKTSPFFVIIFSSLFLGEKMKRLQIPAILMAICGIVLISPPKLDYSFLPALAALLSAVFAGAAYTTLRHLRLSDKPLVIVFYLTMVSSLAMIPLLLGGFWVTPDPFQLLVLCSVGLFALVGQFLMTTAYRHAQAGEVSIYSYSNVVFAMVLGAVFWKEKPEFFSILGALTVVAGAYLNAHSGLKASRKAARERTSARKNGD